MKSFLRRQLLQYANGLLFTKLLYVAASLNLADRLRPGGESVGALASQCDVDAEVLYRIMRALSSAGVFVEKPERRFELNAAAELLLSDSPDSIRGVALMMGSPWWWKACGELEGTLSGQSSGFARAFGMEAFEFMESDPDAASIFDEAMRELTASHTDAIISSFDFAPFETIVDVGGGDGSLLAAILRAHPGPSGVLFDREDVLQRARQGDAVARLHGRLVLVPGDCFDSVPKGGDVYILKGILHDWDDTRALKILRSCRSAMEKEAILLLIEWDVSTCGHSAPGKLTDIAMLAVFGGRERTTEEYEALLKHADLQLVRALSTPQQMAILEATPR